MPLAVVLITLSIILLPMASGKDPPRGGCFGERRTGRIVGGSDAERSEMPFIVSLTRRGGHFCGATILSEKWLVTAGHCLCNSVNDFMKPSQIRAVLGLHRISEYKLTRDTQMEQMMTKDPPPPVEVLLESVTIHPQYNCLRSANDIALLEMKPIQFSPTIRPTCIAMEDETFDGTEAMVSGWGWTHENQSIGQRADTLQKASVEVWNNLQCQASFTAHEKSIGITENQLCAGRIGGGVDACWADSGGPLVSSEGLLIGIVSTGIGCARPELPGIYTRVTKYAKWIQQVIGTSIK